MTPPTARARYRKVLLQLAHEPWRDGLPEAPYLVAGVTFSRVAEVMGITRPALYRLWETQYDFWIDLSRYIAYEIDYSQHEHELPWQARHVTGAPRPRLDAHQADREISTSTNAVQAIVMDDLRILIRAASIGYPDIADLGQVRRQVELKRLESLGEDIGLSWQAVSGATIGPAVEQEMAATMWCIADELAVLNRFIPEICEAHVAVDFGQGECSWSVLALAMRSLCYGHHSPSTDNVDQPTQRRWYEIPPPDDPWSDAQLAALDVARQLFLDSITGHDTVLNNPEILGYVTVARVASTAGVSRRTIYNVWPTRDEMMSDLLEDLLQQHLTDVLTPFTATSATVDLRAAITSLLGPAGMAAPVDPLLAFMVGIGNNSHHAAIRRTNLMLVKQIAQHLGTWLDEANRRPCVGVGLEQLAVIWLCLARGGRRLRRTSPQHIVALDVAAEVIMRELTVQR